MQQETDHHGTTRPYTFLIIGQSGAGKKTNVDAMVVHLQSTEPDRGVVISETGELFRTMTKTAPPWLIDEINSTQTARKFQPYIHALNVTINELYRIVKTNQEHLIIDGSPRSVDEATHLLFFLENVMRRKPIIIHLIVSDDTARERILGRNAELEKENKEVRMETTTLGAINTKLAAYHEQTVPAINSVPKEYVIEIDAESDPKTVFASILEKLTLRHSMIPDIINS